MNNPVADALPLFAVIFFASYPHRQEKSRRIARGRMNNKPKKLLYKVREHIRIMHLSMSTEDGYLGCPGMPGPKRIDAITWKKVLFKKR
jgi:hypothetical protein